MKSRLPVSLRETVATVSLAVALFAPIGLATELGRPDLKGRILGPSQEPIGGAHIFIYTAKPKEGPAYLCPSCYADCGKQTVSGPEGRFSVESLDSGLLFRILVVKEGFLSKVLGVRSQKLTIHRSDLPIWPWLVAHSRQA